MAKKLTLLAVTGLAASQATDSLGPDQSELGVQVIHVGTLAGNIHLQGSLDGITWSNLQDSTGVDILIVALAGGALNRTYWFVGAKGGRVRANFTRTSGTGDLTIIMEG